MPEVPELTVDVGQGVSEEPFEGERPEGAPAEGYQEQEGAVPAYEEIFEFLTGPNLAVGAPYDSGLRDIAEASFGPLAESVLGTDDRIQITNTPVYPWRMNASLSITAADNSLWIGTGWFIGPHTLVTAGHCVFIHAPGTPRHGWVRSIRVMPGRNAATLPYGSVTSTEFRAVSGWTQSKDENYDYGAIIIPTELGNTVGWFGFGVYPDSDLESSTVCVSGYPGDKPSGTQWYCCRQVDRVNSMKVYYALDTAGGQSGSAVYRVINGDYYGVAIHAYGGTSNSGTRIMSEVYENLVDWKA
jgi:V8-like Glu-specific endopeptidase